MKRINDDELRFVVEHYKENRIDTEKAWKKVKAHIANEPRRRWRISVVAASVVAVAVVAVACFVIGYGNNKPVRKQNDTPVTVDTVPVKSKGDSIVVFRFADEPVGSALRRLSAHYGKRLTSSDSTKILSGEIEAASCDEVVSIIESTLNIKITVE